ncbi:Paraquat-inducible protein A [Thalassocella blandensis]|nr:Paraquat-inducible protein A [Thalassocella blandensis]
MKGLNIADAHVLSRAWFRLIFALYLVNVIAFLCGVFLPLLTVSKLMLISNTFSVASGVQQLYWDGQYFLFVVIALFSIGFPLMKMCLLGAWLLNPKRSRFTALLRWVHHFGKWSMLDVFVVAVLVVAVKLAGLASVEMREGLYFFTLSVLLTMILTHVLAPFYNVAEEAGRIGAGLKGKG